MEKEIINLINNSNRALIITHINPDGDTLGCASALKYFMGDKADILIQIKDNFDFPNTYSFLENLNNSKNLSTLKDEYDLIIALDVASIDRIIDKARAIFEKCENTIVIDHHKTNTGFAKINYIKGGISSTGEVLYDFFKKMDIKITPKMAQGLYSAILTDTGCFKYESTTPHTFAIASEISKIIDTSKIADLCYTNKPKNLILFQNYLVSNAKFCLNDKIAYTLITKEIVEKFSAKDEYSEGICETLRSISGVEIAFVLKETQQNKIKVSIRTKEVDATKITEKFNGGGHKRAAGCTIKEKINHAVELLIEEAKNIL